MATPLRGDRCRIGEMRRQKLSGPIQSSDRFVKDRIKGLEDVRHPRSDVKRDVDIGNGSLSGEADGVIEENLVGSSLDDQRRQARQISKYRADEVKSGVSSRRIVADSGLEVCSAHQHVDLALGLHGRSGQCEVGIR